jgi:hypothetical protein
MMHISASIFILFPLIKRIELTNKTLSISLVLVFLLIIVLGKSLIAPIMNYMTFGDSLSESIQGYGNQVVRNTKSLGYLFYTLSTYFFFPLFIIYNSLKINKYKIRFPYVLFCYFVISLFSTLSADFIRFNHYLFVFLLIEISTAMCVMIMKYKIRLFIVIIIPLILNATNIHYLFIAGTSLVGEKGGAYKRYFPYTNVFTKEMTKERRDYYIELNRRFYDYK